MKILLTIYLLIILQLSSLGQQMNSGVMKIWLKAPQDRSIAAFAEGCFWCVEHIFESVTGVDSAVSGYAGGHTKDPTYARVNTETTGHAETVIVYYDPQVVTYEELVDVFFLSHDPTTLNRQGPDIGSSYRSILFYLNDEEKEIAKNRFSYYSKYGLFKDPIVTEIKELTEFYKAEGYHQNFIKLNPGNGYVQNVSLPRYKEFKKRYRNRVRN